MSRHTRLQCLRAAVRRIGLGLLAVLGLAVTNAHSQVFSTLSTFNGTGCLFPMGDLTLSGSTLYGTANQGGAYGYGAVFSVPVTGGSPTVLTSFNSTNGAYPYDGLTLSGSTLFGTTYGGGASGLGAVFSLPVTGGSPTVLGSFNGTNGQYPESSLTLIGSTLYGTASAGGANGYGAVFSLATTGGTPTALASLSSTNGAYPQAGLVANGSNLYGTASQGGSSNYGSVFSVPTAGGAATLLGSFSSSNGSSPYSGMTLVGTKLYGTTLSGGAYGYGAVYSIPVSGGSPTILASFNGTNGQYPYADLAVIGNTLYGTTERGGVSNEGVIFSLPLSGGSPTVLTAFSGSNGAWPDAGLTVSGNTLYGVTKTGNSNYGTVFALNVAPATVVLGNASNAAAITGGTATLGVTVSNASNAGYNLNYAMTAAVLSGSASLGAITPSTGSLAPAASQACTIPAVSTKLGVTTLSFTASDPNSTNLSQSGTAALTVYDHANASLTSGAAATTQTINFGNVLRGAIVPSQSFTIYNLAANTTANYTTNLKLTGFTSSGDTAFSTNLAAFAGLTAASGSNGNTFTASLNTANDTTSGTRTITMSAAQLADDSSLPGAGSNNNGGATVTMVGNVGTASAAANNSPSSFGPALSAQVAVGGSYANLQSTVVSTGGSGGNGAVGTTATVLAGTNATAAGQTVSMQWRTRTTGKDSIFVSDVLNLSGLSLDGSGSGQTAPYVLQMSYDTGRYGADEASLAAAGKISLDYLDPSTGLWVNAVEGNFGVNQGSFYDAPWQPGDLTPGDWGVDTANHTVWAVLNHDSQFAIVPEPSSLALLIMSAMGLVWLVRSARSSSR